MKSNLNGLISAAVLLCITCASCKKNDQPVSFPSTSKSTTDSLLLNANSIIANAGDEQNSEVADIVGSNSVVSGDSVSCRTVTYNSSASVYPHLKTVDFGSGCIGKDGITRSGRKLITVYADWKNATAGTLISETTFDNFYVDSVNVSGNSKLYIDSSTKPGMLALKIVTNKTFTDSKGNTSTFMATNYWLQTAGNNTTTRADNVYRIIGSASGSEVLDGATMLTWTSKIDGANPVIKMGDCIYRSKGSVDIQLNLEGSSIFNEHLDYGNGTCDNEATLAINGGMPQQVTLPLRFWPLSL